MQLLIICGPTATGKTKLALHLARRFNGELISADSRQVYRGMDIGTGKDVPVNFKFLISNFEFNTKKISYYTDGKIRMWGLDVVNPDEEFSVAHFRVFVDIVLADIYKRNKLPIVVGGTGLYIKALLEPLSYVVIPRNEQIRKQYENVSINVLQKALQEMDSNRFESMNNSDRNNPRRLVRAIEIAQYHKSHTTHETHMTHVTEYNTLTVGLRASDEVLRQRIKKRVEKRLKQGVADEVRTLLRKGYRSDLSSMSVTGYTLIMSNVKCQMSKKEIFSTWVREEYQYAKRQMTWFKKQKNIEWFDTEQKNWEQTVVDRMKEWYTGS